MEPSDEALIPRSGGEDDGIVLERILPYLANRLSYKMNDLLRKDLKKYGLRIAEWRVLAVLAANPGSTVNQLAEYAMIEQSTLSRLLDRMMAAGLLIRAEDKTDARARLISLTAEGQEKFAAVRAVALAHTQRILHGLSAEECEQYRRLIVRMTENLEREFDSPAQS